MMSEIIFALCALMSITCAGLLLRGYCRERSHLLLWSSICFAVLAVTNTILFVDLVMLPDIEFRGGLWRNLLTTVASSLLVFGLIWELV
jgi:hypothetical protein